MNPDELARLEEERSFLLSSLRDLEREREAEDIDDLDYVALHNGYTHRAAEVIKLISRGEATLPRRQSRPLTQRLVLIFAVLALAVGSGWLVAAQSGQRLPGQSSTGGIENSTATLLAQARSINFSDPATAIDTYSQILELNPDHVEALTYRSWLIALVAREATEEVRLLALAAATQGLGHAIEVEPNYPDAHCFLGIVRFRLAGDALGAKEELDICASMNPPAEVQGFVDSIRTEVAAALGE